jgi:predicted transposase YdaD
VFQEGKEEGLKEGIEQERQRSLQEKLRSVSNLAALNLPPEKIAESLGLDIDLVRTQMANNHH